MGTFFYGAMFEAIAIPDWILAHVKVVVTAKLRRGECFPLSWRHPDDQPGGRTTIWLHPSISLRFVSDSPEVQTLDTAMLHAFMNAANSNSGLVIEMTDPVPADQSAVAELSLQSA